MTPKSSHKIILLIKQFHVFKGLKSLYALTFVQKIKRYKYFNDKNER